MPFDSEATWGIIWFVGGILVTLIFHLLGRKTKILEYSFYTRKLITKEISEIDGLDVFFNGDKVPDVASTVLVLANEGSDIIELTDFAKNDPLVIQTNGIFLLSGSIDSFVTKPNKTMAVSLELVDESTIKVNFEFVRRNKCIELSLLHTGSDISINGTLKKGKIKDSAKSRKWLSIVFFRRYLLIMLTLECAALAVFRLNINPYMRLTAHVFIPIIYAIIMLKLRTKYYL